jgi:hypothetical protein
MAVDGLVEVIREDAEPEGHAFLQGSQKHGDLGDSAAPLCSAGAARGAHTSRKRDTRGRETLSLPSVLWYVSGRGIAWRARCALAVTVFR